jgi:hypothetical protein
MGMALAVAMYVTLTQSSQLRIAWGCLRMGSAMMVFGLLPPMLARIEVPLGSLAALGLMAWVPAVTGAVLLCLGPAMRDSVRRHGNRQCGGN